MFLMEFVNNIFRKVPLIKKYWAEIFNNITLTKFVYHKISGSKILLLYM